MVKAQNYESISSTHILLAKASHMSWPSISGQKVYFTLVELQNHMAKNMSTERSKKNGENVKSAIVDKYNDQGFMLILQN